jgi:tRNA(Ile)-lysidine synthase
MIEKLQETFHNPFPLDFTRILVVGVSGGPDSLCLLDMLVQSGLRLVLAHMNHQLRTEADQDAEHVQKIADGYGIPCVIEVENVEAYAEVHGLSVEEAARIVRYRFLFSEAEKRDAQAVVVGHTADDQVETVLMHLLRGTGLEGLQGMEPWQLPNVWSKEIALARPLLGLWREETEAYCHEHGLQPVIDQSNFERTYFRNRLRHEVIPMLATHSPRFKEKLVRLAEVLRGDYQVLEPMVESTWRECLTKTEDGYLAFERKQFEGQLLGMQRRLIRRAMDQLRPGLRDIGFDTVERGLAFLRQPGSSGQVDLASGLRLVAERERVWIAKWEADLPGMGWPKMKGEPAHLNSMWVLSLEDGWQMVMDLVSDVEEGKRLALENSDPYQAWLDADQTPAEFEVRSRRAGDRIRPLGMEGHSVKISDLMVNVKMPQRARAGWPLVCCLDEVLWVPGYAASHTSRVRSDTRQIFHLTLAHKA